VPSEADPLLLLPTKNPAHSFWADLNAGACVFIELGTTLGPPGLGSGKLGTPFARMHSASLTAGSLAARLEVAMDPQATSAAAQVAPAIAIQRPWRCLPSISVVLWLLTFKPSRSGVRLVELYAMIGNRGVTGVTTSFRSPRRTGRQLRDGEMLVATRT